MFLKVLYTFGAIFISIVSHCENRYSAIEVIQDGQIQIIGVNDILNCDGIICPHNSIFCYVTIDTIDNLDDVQRLRVCMDINGSKTKVNKDILPNPNTGEHYHIYSSNYDIE